MKILQLSLWNHKRCRRCTVMKAPELFSTAKQNRDGLHGYCKDCHAELNRERNAKDPERHRTDSATWRKNNPEKARRYEQSRRAMHRAKDKRYRDRHPDRNAARANRYYARKQKAEGTHTTREWLDLCVHYAMRCLCCGAQKRLTIDHVIPLSQGGSDTIDNLQPLCMRCNARKGGRHIDYRPVAQQ